MLLVVLNKHRFTNAILLKHIYIQGAAELIDTFQTALLSEGCGLGGVAIRQAREDLISFKIFVFLFFQAQWKGGE